MLRYIFASLIESRFVSTEFPIGRAASRQRVLAANISRFSTEFFLDGVDHADRQTDEKRRRKIAEGIRECGEATLAMSAKGTRLDAIRRRVSFTVSDSRHRLLLSYSSSCSAMGCSIHVDAPPSNMESMSVLWNVLSRRAARFPIFRPIPFLAPPPSRPFPSIPFALPARPTFSRFFSFFSYVPNTLLHFSLSLSLYFSLSFSSSFTLTSLLYLSLLFSFFLRSEYLSHLLFLSIFFFSRHFASVSYSYDSDYPSAQPSSSVS